MQRPGEGRNAVGAPSWSVAGAPPWHDTLHNFGGSASAVGHVMRWAETALPEVAVRHGLVATNRQVRGAVSDFERVIDALLASGGALAARTPRSRLELDHENVCPEDRIVEMAAVVGPAAAVSLFASQTGDLTAHVFALGDALADRIVAALRDVVVEAPPQEKPPPRERRPVHMIVAGAMGLELARIGFVEDGLCRANYDGGALAEFDALVANLASDAPRGRLAVISGPPGTGKTRMLRGVVHAVPDAAFVVIDPSMLPEMTRPSMIPLLLRLRDNEARNGGPVVFLAEDGDRAVAQRGFDNLEALSALLNLGDGFAGDMLNVHVVVTTNAQHVGLKLDDAVSRPGRLACHIKVGDLGPEHAASLLASILAAEPVAPPPWAGRRATLAQVYEHATACGWKTPPRSRASSGSRLVRLSDG